MCWGQWSLIKHLPSVCDSSCCGCGGLPVTQLICRALSLSATRLSRLADWNVHRRITCQGAEHLLHAGGGWLPCEGLCVFNECLVVMLVSLFNTATEFNSHFYLDKENSDKTQIFSHILPWKAKKPAHLRGNSGIFGPRAHFSSGVITSTAPLRGRRGAEMMFTDT